MLAVTKPGKSLGKGKDGIVGAVHGYPRSRVGVSGMGKISKPRSS
jgi:hypothetical protein